jgi:uncharacterized DUF497 family protein
MKPNFEWDEFKAEKNLRKHGISFQEAASVFWDEFSLTFTDIAHSAGEERFIDIGCSTSGRVLVVVYTERRNNIRIISCRKATIEERKIYESQSS